jgi:hypothetical protein
MHDSTATTSPSSTAAKAMFWVGWVLTILPSLGLIMSAAMKLAKPASFVQEFAKSGFPENVLFPLGVVELTCTILYLIPQTAVLGAILLTGYLGGAVATHVRASENFVAPIIFGILVWLGLFLRDARLRALLPLRR